MDRIEFRGDGVLLDDLLAARLEPGSRRPVLARNNWRVVGMDGAVLGYVRLGYSMLRWQINREVARYATQETALEALLRRKGVLSEKV